MNDECKHVRERIELSIARGTTPDERSAIEKHCDACPGCRQYCEELLADDAGLAGLAANDADTVREIELKAIRSIAETAEKPYAAPSRRRPPAGRRFLRFAAAAAAAIVFFIAFDALRGLQHRPVPAFAAVLAAMEEIDNVVYREQRWSQGKWFECERAHMRPDLARVAAGDSIVLISREVTLHIYPAKRRAERWRRLWTAAFPEHRGSRVERIANWHTQGEYSFVRRERMNGKMALVYESFGRRNRAEGEATLACERERRAGVKAAVWVDAQSKLPVRVTFTYPPDWRKREPYKGYGLRVEDFAPPGATSSKIAGWERLEEGEPHLILDNFRWNRKLDPSYFSLEPPEGYAAEEHVTPPPSDSLFAASRPHDVGAIVEALSFWIEITGEFPEKIRELSDTTRVRDLLLAAFDRDGRPGDEYRAAYRIGQSIWLASETVKRLDKPSTWEYFGAGAAPGDSTRILCWMMPYPEHRRPANPYWILFADLHYERVAAAPASRN